MKPSIEKVGSFVEDNTGYVKIYGWTVKTENSDEFLSLDELKYIAKQNETYYYLPDYTQME